MVLLVLLLWMIRQPNRMARKVLSRVIEDIQASISIRQITPFEVRLIQRFDQWILWSMLLLLVAALYFSFGPFMGTICAGPILFGTAYLAVAFRQLDRWRAYFHGLHGLWVAIGLVTSIPILFIVAIGCMLFVQAMSPQMEPMPFHQTANMITAAFTDSRSLHLPPRELAYEILQILQVTPHAAQWVLMLVAIGIGVTGVLLTACHLNATRISRSMLLSDQAPVRLAAKWPDPPLTGRLDRGWVITNAVLFGLVNWIYSLIALDVAVHLLFGKPLLMAPLGWSLELMKGFVHHAGMSVDGAQITVTVVFLFFALPGLTVWAVTLWRLLKLTGSYFAYSLSPLNPLDDTMTQWIYDICQAHELPLPQIRQVNRPGPLMYVEGRLWRGRGRLVISCDCYEHLSKEHVQALLAHEMGHLFDDAHRIARLKFFSLLMLSPSYYLLILYDFAGRERMADQFAAEVMGQSQTLRAALVKWQVSSVLNKKNPAKKKTSSGRFLFHAVWHAIWRVIQSLSLHFDDSIFAAAYPSLKQRLAWLNERPPTSSRIERS